MALRLPQTLSSPVSSVEASDAGLKVELMAEKAASLGRAGRRVEKALAVLREAAAEDRPAALKDAADAVWSLFVQSEVCGQRAQKPVIAIYGMPKDVLARLGAR